MKSKRHESILKIIADNNIETQEDLIQKLLADGFDVTQATVSRDIRELKLIKVMNGQGSYKYIQPTRGESSGNVKFNTALVESIVSVKYAANIVVIKTFSGLANAVASGVDNLNNPHILGCVAGDDTIIAVTSDIDAAKEISEKIRHMIKEL